MIFVCLGTQTFQFNRLIKKLDELVGNGIIKEKVFAQIGHASYFPSNYEYKEFVSKDEFSELQHNADLIITHGGTGALIGASKQSKNIIAVPRLAKYGEHIDDHQLQIVKVLEKEGYVRAVYDIDMLGATIIEAIETPINKRYERESEIIPIIENFIEGLKKQ